MNRLDIVTGHFFFYSHSCNGQSSGFYKRLSKICSYFEPGPVFERIFMSNTGEDCNSARDVYAELCEKHEEEIPYQWTIESVEEDLENCYQEEVIDKPERRGVFLSDLEKEDMKKSLLDGLLCGRYIYGYDLG